MSDNIYYKHVHDHKTLFVPMTSVSEYMLARPATLHWSYAAELIIDNETGQVVKSKYIPLPQYA